MKSKNVKVRATAHRGRAGKHGAYNPKHNDRNFNASRSEHIDHEKSCQNTYWHRYQKTDPHLTFEDAEKRFYEETFAEALEMKNNRYIKNRHRERVKTMDEYRTSEKFCPEEIIFQLGTHDQKRPSSRLLWNIISEFSEWQKSLWYDKRDEVRIVPLDMALHRDEEAADHVHLRQVYLVRNKDGFFEINQEECLKRIGIERNDPTKERSRYNNRKKAFTAIARNKFIEIAKSHGVDIIEKPKEVGKSGLELMQYKAQQEQSNLDRLYFELKCLETDYRHLLIEKDSLQKKVDELNNSPALQQPKVIERDKYIKDYYPHVWKMANEYANHTQAWTPPTQTPKARPDIYEVYR